MATPIRSQQQRSKKRRANGPGVELKARVTPDVRELARLGAAARNVTLARYIEMLIEDDEVAQHCQAQQQEERLTG
jgi:predicted HicB family RNase H-like nuclease